MHADVNPHYQYAVVLNLSRAYTGGAYHHGRESHSHRTGQAGHHGCIASSCRKTGGLRQSGDSGIFCQLFTLPGDKSCHTEVNLHTLLFPGPQKCFAVSDATAIVRELNPGEKQANVPLETWLAPAPKPSPVLHETPSVTKPAITLKLEPSPSSPPTVSPEKTSVIIQESLKFPALLDVEGQQKLIKRLLPNLRKVTMQNLMAMNDHFSPRELKSILDFHLGIPAIHQGIDTVPFPVGWMNIAEYFEKMQQPLTLPGQYHIRFKGTPHFKEWDMPAILNRKPDGINNEQYLRATLAHQTLLRQHANGNTEATEVLESLSSVSWSHLERKKTPDDIKTVLTQKTNLLSQAQTRDERLKLLSSLFYFAANMRNIMNTRIPDKEMDITSRAGRAEKAIIRELFSTINQKQALLKQTTSTYVPSPLPSTIGLHQWAANGASKENVFDLKKPTLFEQNYMASDFSEKARGIQRGERYRCVGDH
jgi:hypothetical protein